MPSKESYVPELHTLLTGLAFGESPRWHAGRLWFSDWAAQEVIAVDLEGKHEVITRVQSHRLAARWAPADRVGEHAATPAQRT